MIASMHADQQQFLVYAAWFFSAFIVSAVAAALAYALVVRPSK
ncbi:hypothetical protein [Agrobacterium tumefaciens]